MLGFAEDTATSDSTLCSEAYFGSPILADDQATQNS